MSGLLWALLSPRAAAACAVCFNPNDKSGLAEGFKWGLIALLGTTFIALAGIILAIAKIERAHKTL